MRNVNFIDLNHYYVFLLTALIHTECHPIEYLNPYWISSYWRSQSIPNLTILHFPIHTECHPIECLNPYWMSQSQLNFPQIECLNTYWMSQALLNVTYSMSQSILHFTLLNVSIHTECHPTEYLNPYWMPLSVASNQQTTAVMAMRLRHL